jgi:hypothetical protein
MLMLVNDELLVQLRFPHLIGVWGYVAIKSLVLNYIVHAVLKLLHFYPGATAIYLIPNTYCIPNTDIPNCARMDKDYKIIV